MNHLSNVNISSLEHDTSDHHDNNANQGLVAQNHRELQQPSHLDDSELDMEWKGVIKPNIVFFGEQLPQKVFHAFEKFVFHLE